MNAPTNTPATTTTETYITLPEVARRLSIGRRAAENWVKRFAIPHYKFGRTPRFLWADVQQHLTKFRVGSALE